MQQKELALPSGSKAYFTVVRTGLNNAYLAACVVGSRLVSTSRTGAMSKVGARFYLQIMDSLNAFRAISALPCLSCVCPISKPDLLVVLSQAGEALELLSGAVPVVGGLAGLAAAALKAGDHHMQTRRVVRVSSRSCLEYICVFATTACVLYSVLSLGLRALILPSTFSCSDRSLTWQLMRWSVARWRGRWPYDSPMLLPPASSPRPTTREKILGTQAWWRLAMGRVRSYFVLFCFSHELNIPKYPSSEPVVTKAGHTFRCN